MANIIEMPKLSDTMTSGTVVSWLKKEGDVVESGDILAEIETDKATQELECFDEGTILKIYIQAGGKAPCGQPLCAVGEKGEEAPKVETTTATPDGEKAKPAPAENQKPKEEKVSPPKPEPKASKAPSATSSGQRTFASPLARKIAEDKGIPLEAIKGSGPSGRIVQADVIAAAQAGVKGIPAAAVPLEEKLTPVSTIREVIARRLLESKTQVPHFYLEKEVNAAPLLKTRVALNEKLKKLGQSIKLTVNDYILKASAEALRTVPAMNTSWEGENIRQHGAVHLSFGVALEDGLVTPVIRDAEKKDLVTISREARELIDKARAKKLTPEEMSGSTFTVTNLGMYGVNRFYGIINPPNAGILSVGGTFKKPIVDENDNIVIGHRMSIGISGDHRVVDGAVGALFLQALAENLENPAIMLV
ncbi:MAG: dihydrolipoamide acetyltransferase family protein [Opitutales bacterium]|nr:dihydrolipoamide acetyltransferase family protein [Opitutales bacterium]